MKEINTLTEINEKTIVKHTIKVSSIEDVNNKVSELKDLLKQESKLSYKGHLIKTIATSGFEIEFSIEVNPSVNQYDIR